MGCRLASKEEKRKRLKNEYGFQNSTTNPTQVRTHLRSKLILLERFVKLHLKIFVAKHRDREKSSELVLGKGK